MTDCSVEDCSRPSRRRGLCSLHSDRYYRHGDVHTNKYPGRESLEAGFWAKVGKRGADECWPWLGATSTAGYGSMTHNRKHVSAHRVSYELHIGPIPTGYAVDHLCRNRLCVNYAHLEAVTPKENQRRTTLLICRQGHPYTPESTVVRKDGYKECKICIHNNRVKARMKAIQLRSLYRSHAASRSA